MVFFFINLQLKLSKFKKWLITQKLGTFIYLTVSYPEI